MRIGAYEVVSELGRGGMGVVYRARSQDGREVAIKVLSGSRPESLARFERERRLVALFGEREGFVPLLDHGSSPGGPFIVMPLVPGGTLADRLRRGPLGIDETIALGRALAEAVARAHERGIVHRDLKPENILFTRDGPLGKPLVADLGLAKHWRRDAPEAAASRSLSQAGALRGTFGYAAPEQMSDAKSAGPAADVFSLGAILYECLAGRPAFEGETIVVLAERVAEGRVEPLSRLRPEAPAWLAGTIARALAREAEDRFQDASALASALGRAPPGKRRVARLAAAALGVVGLLLASVGAVLFLEGTEPTAAELVASARAKRERGLADGVIALATRALELDPGVALAWALRADAHRTMGDLDGAIRDSTKAIELDSKLAFAWGVRGDVRRRKGDPQGAAADSTRAIELDPKLGAAWSTRAEARRQKGDLEGAIADSTNAIALEPTQAFDWACRAEARRLKGDQDGAALDSTRAIELDPKLALGWASRGEVRRVRGDLDGAILDETRAIALDSKQIMAWVVRGEARRKKGDLEGAIQDSTSALALDAKIALAWAVRADARREKGDLAGARTDCERFLELAPDDPRAEEMRGWLLEVGKRE